MKNGTVIYISSENISVVTAESKRDVLREMCIRDREKPLTSKVERSVYNPSDFYFP